MIPEGQPPVDRCMWPTFPNHDAFVAFAAYAQREITLCARRRHRNHADRRFDIAHHQNTRRLFAETTPAPPQERPA